jgi:23S rRNA pseudouridine955/2504/2580 synthase
MRKNPVPRRPTDQLDKNPSTETQPKSVGVRHVEAGEGDAGQRIDNFLLRHLKNVPRSRVYRILRTGQVRVNGKRIGPEFRLSEGDRVRIPPVRLDPKPEVAAPSRSLRDYIEAAILFEDRDLLIINKPAGIAVHGGSGLSFGVIEALRAMKPELQDLELVHRLDRETSGCLVVAKRRAALRELHALLREREMEKTYLALLCGRWPFGTKTLDLPLKTNLKQGGERVVKVHADGLQAVSTFTPIKQFGKIATLVEVSIGTGRTHQIRVHAAHAGYPIAGDTKYGDREREAPIRSVGLNRMFLHASRLRFQRQNTREAFEIEAPLPVELQEVLDRLSQQR